MSLFIIVLLFHLWSYLQSQLRLPAFARTMASYINILLTRTVNCLLTKQKSYWQQPRRGRGCVCVCWESVSLWESEREKERGGGWWGERGWQREPLNVRPLLVWTPTGLSAGTHLSNALNAAPTLDCTISLSATKYRARGIRRSLSAVSNPSCAPPTVRLRHSSPSFICSSPHVVATWIRLAESRWPLCFQKSSI